MAMEKSALLELLEALKAGGVDDRIRLAAQSMYQALIDAEAEGVIGAGFWERTEARTAIRNGSRQRLLSTTAGDLELRIPKLRAGSFFPSLLERRRRIDQVLFAVIMEAYLHSVSTRNSTPTATTSPWAANPDPSKASPNAAAERRRTSPRRKRRRETGVNDVLRHHIGAAG
jgi:hypothetical protein